jgi:hypothetical protein
MAPDGRTLCALSYNGPPALLETLTAKTVRKLPAPVRAYAASYSPDGRTLATGGPDGTILIWDLTGTADPNMEFETLWSTLSSSDAHAAYDAVWTLAARGNKTIETLSAKFRPDTPSSIESQLTDMDSDEAAERERATAELARMGPDIEPLLREALKRDGLSNEVQSRVKYLLDLIAQSAGKQPKILAQLRGIHALELIGTEGAIQALRTIAAQATSSLVRRHAERAAARATSTPSEY